MTPRPSGGARAGALVRALAVLLSVAPAPAPATAAPLTRAQAVARALSSAPEEAAFRAAIADSARLVAAAGANENAPRIGFAAEFDRLAPFNANASELRLELTHELDPARRRDARREVATAEATVTHAAAFGHAHALARRTEETFGALLVAHRRVALADSAAATATRLALAGRRAARAEAISPYDARRLELDGALRQERARAARGERAEAEAALRTLLLAPADEEFEPLDDPPAPWRCAPESLAQIALERRHDVVESRAGERLLGAESRLAAREGRPGPEFSVFVARERERVEADAFGPALAGVPGFDGFHDSGPKVGAMITLPLSFMAPRRWHADRLDVATQQARAARLRLESEVPIQVAAACARVTAAQERLALLSGALGHADEDRARVETAYRAGRLELESALAQRERLFAAAEAELEALADLEAARSALARATGLSHAELAAALGGAPRGESR